MRSQREKNTAPEIALRRELHRLGMRYRVHQKPLKGLRRTVDVLFRQARVAVEVYGCFWHQCPEHATKPRSNDQWWAEKLEGNQRRDVATKVALEAQGWELVVVWEHEDPVAAAQRVAAIVRARRELIKER